MDKHEIFKKRLILARNKRGFSQSELAERSGLKPAAISHFETGNRKPSFDNLRLLSDSLNVTADFLLGRTNDPEGFAESDIAFRHGYEKLSSEQRDMALNFIDMLSNKK